MPSYDSPCPWNSIPSRGSGGFNSVNFLQDTEDLAVFPSIWVRGWLNSAIVGSEWHLCFPWALGADWWDSLF